MQARRFYAGPWEVGGLRQPQDINAWGVARRPRSAFAIVGIEAALFEIRDFDGIEIAPFEIGDVE